MKVQVLVAALNQNDFTLLDRMNIQSDCIVGNQCDKNEVISIKYKGYNVKYLSFAERGVGLNRNNTLMRADGDICLFADDDMCYVEDYPKIVEKVYMEIPDADIIIFNLHEKEPKRYIIKKKFRVTKLNYMRFGAARISARVKSLRRSGIFFNQCFGGGTNYNNGEDTLFLNSCLNNGLKIYAVPVYIASLNESRESTWFKGYNNKYFNDKGALYYTISKKLAWLLCLQDVIRHSTLYSLNGNIYYNFKLMIDGIRQMKES